MIGSSTILGKVNEKDFSFMNIHKWITTKNLFKSTKCVLYKSVYENYPFFFYEDDNFLYSIEGFIYNLNQKEIHKYLLSIISNINKAKIRSQELSIFINAAEGDFFIQLLDKKNEIFFAFNDCVGVLPIYYSFENDIFQLSRSQKFIIHNRKRLDYDSKGLYQKVSFGFHLSDNTSLKDVKLLKSGSYIFVDLNAINKYKIETYSSHNFILNDQYETKEQAISDIVNELRININRIVSYCKRNHYSIINTLSGGFDSRIILALLSTTNVDQVSNFTFEYIQDESVIAEPLWQKLRVPGTYKKLSFINDISKIDLSTLQYCYDGRVNSYTNAICHNDTMFLKNNLEFSKVVVLNGFGGELFRKPYKKKVFNFGIQKLCEFGVYSNYRFIKKYFAKKVKYNSEFLDYLEVKPSDQIKHLYWEYYLNLVLRSGEDRGRTFTPVCHPLISKKIVQIFSNKVPLEWINFDFFISILEKINKDVLSIPIFKSNIDLQSKKSILEYDKNYPFDIPRSIKLKKMLKYIIGYYPSINSFDDKLYSNYLALVDKIEGSYNTIFPLHEVKKTISRFGIQQNELISEARYWNKISQLYKEKFYVKD